MSSDLRIIYTLVAVTMLTWPQQTFAADSSAPVYQIVDLGETDHPMPDYDRSVDANGGADTTTYNGSRMVMNDTGQIIRNTRVDVQNVDDKKRYGALTFHAFLWEDKKQTDLGSLPLGKQTLAFGINRTGEVVGEAGIPGRCYGDLNAHAFLWKNGTMQDLGLLPKTDFSSAYEINDREQVIGVCGIAGCDGPAPPPPRPFLWQAGKMYDLNDLTPGRLGWILEKPTAINNRGEILGWGLFHLKPHRFLLIPIGKV